MKKASILGLSIIILLQGCSAPGNSPRLDYVEHTITETSFNFLGINTEIPPTNNQIATLPASTPSPTISQPTVQ